MTTADRKVVDRLQFYIWWGVVLWAVLAAAFGFYLLGTYGLEGVASLIGLGFAIWSGWMFCKALSLRRYVWYGDLD